MSYDLKRESINLEDEIHIIQLKDTHKTSKMGTAKSEKLKGIFKGILYRVGTSCGVAIEWTAPWRLQKE